MIKAAGCVLIIYAAFMAGHAVGQMHVRMVREIEELLLFIQMIKGEMSYAGSDLYEIMCECEQRLCGPIREWVIDIRMRMEEQSDRPFAELWAASMSRLEDVSLLRRDVLGDVDRLGKLLGDMDVDAQLSRIELLEGVVRERYGRESGRSDGIRRLSSSLGLLGGLFIALVLV